MLARPLIPYQIWKALLLNTYEESMDPVVDS